MGQPFPRSQRRAAISPRPGVSPSRRGAGKDGDCAGGPIAADLGLGGGLPGPCLGAPPPARPPWSFCGFQCPPGARASFTPAAPAHGPLRLGPRVSRMEFLTHTPPSLPRPSLPSAPCSRAAGLSIQTWVAFDTLFPPSARTFRPCRPWRSVCTSRAPVCLGTGTVSPRPLHTAEGRARASVPPSMSAHHAHAW